MADTILIVDDEESVRRTFRDWLTEANLDSDILTASDAEEALGHAQRVNIDLAVLDWNLGAGSDGLQLLQDLSIFRPDIVAILVTGYAHQATPLDALRMGVRDYLDKSNKLSRETFIAAVKKQLDKIAPAKKQRQWHATLAAFRSSVEKVLPLVESAAAITDPLPMSVAAARLCRFLVEAVGARSGVLMIRSVRDGVEHCRAFDTAGDQLPGPFAPFAKSLAASALTLGDVSAIADLSSASLSGAELQPFERGKTSVLIAPLAVGSDVAAVLELFDKPGGFHPEDRKLAAAAAAVGAALLDQEIGARRKQQTLFEAVEAALQATEVDAKPPGERDVLEPVLQTVRAGIDRVGAAARGGPALELAEAVQHLTARHGPEAVRHCLRLVESLTELLDETAGAAPPFRSGR